MAESGVDSRHATHLTSINDATLAAIRSPSIEGASNTLLVVSSVSHDSNTLFLQKPAECRDYGLPQAKR